MEEFDSHTEHAEEQAHEAAHESREKWITGVALTAALLAAMAALASLLAGHHEHEAMMEQMQASDEWSHFQAKGIKAEIREERVDNLKLAGEKVPDALAEKVIKARSEQKEIAARAGELQVSSRFHDHLHMILAGGVTLFQVAIAVSAISALTRRQAYWFIGIALGALALGFFVSALLVWGGAVAHRPPEPKGENVAAIRPQHLARC